MRIEWKNKLRKITHFLRRKECNIRANIYFEAMKKPSQRNKNLSRVNKTDGQKDKDGFFHNARLGSRVKSRARQVPLLSVSCARADRY